MDVDRGICPRLSGETFHMFSQRSNVKIEETPERIGKKKKEEQKQMYQYLVVDLSRLAFMGTEFNLNEPFGE